jgi:hypothetical protein
MAHFYGTLNGSRGEATRCGAKASGMETYCASWNGAVRCKAYVNDEGVDCVYVTLCQWQGRGLYPARVLYDGPMSGAPVPEKVTA